MKSLPKWVIEELKAFWMGKRIERRVRERLEYEETYRPFEDADESCAPGTEPGCLPG